MALMNKQKLEVKATDINQVVKSKQFGTTDPTTATKGYFLGQIYTNKTNGKNFALTKRLKLTEQLILGKN